MPVLEAVSADRGLEPGIDRSEPGVRFDVGLDPRKPLDRLRRSLGDQGDPEIRVLAKLPDGAEDRELLGLPVLDRAEEDQAAVVGAEPLPLDVEIGRMEVEDLVAQVGGVRPGDLPAQRP